MRYRATQQNHVFINLFLYRFTLPWRLRMTPRLLTRRQRREDCFFAMAEV
jgi:hypothetical protein